MGILTLYLAVASLLTLALYFLLSPKRGKGKLPPGPRGLPLVGNLLQIGPRMHLVLKEWAKEYGKIFTIELGLEKIVVIDDLKLMKEMLNEPAFSGKPQNDLFLSITEGPNGVLNTESEVWEAQRRFILRNLRDFGFGKSHMEDKIIDEVKEVLDWLKAEEGKAVSMSRKFSIAVLNSLWTITSGKRYPQNDPTLTNMLDTTIEAFNQLMKTGILIFAPWARHIAPELSGWNRLQRALKKMIAFYKNTVTQHRKTFSANHIRDFVDCYIQEINNTTDPGSSFHGEKGYKNLTAVIGDLFQAGAETSSTTLLWAVLYLTHHPHVQERLQREIDEVVGKSRLPSLSDRPNMPYTESVIYEVLRYSSLVPTGVFHRAVSTKEFQGYVIPKGTWIISNLYSVHNNNEIWGDSENFRPERHLSKDGKSAKRPEGLVAFQTGRRQCLGETLALQTQFLFITSIFQHFNIFPDPENPKPDFEANIGFIQMPKNFKVVMKDRLA